MNQTVEVLKHTENALKNFQVKRNRDAEKWAFREWLLKYMTVKKGGKFIRYSLDGFEPFLDIIDNLHKCPELWVLKGTQIGMTTIFQGWALYLPHWRGYDVSYGLPDKTMIRPHMKTRFGEWILGNNAELKRIYKEHETNLYYSCGDAYLYFLGANVLRQMLERPMDAAILDEVTEIKQKSIDLIDERMDASPFAQFIGFARELYPGGPADMGFQDGTQHVHMFRCTSCGHWQNLEEIFYNSSLNKEPYPKCVRKFDDIWLTVCEKCQKPLNRAECGAWVAKHPNRDQRSYRVPQIIMPAMDMTRLMHKWQKGAKKKSKRVEQHSRMLAIPDAGDLQRISKETLLKLKRPFEMRRRSHWTVGGMDMGNSCWPMFLDFEEGSDVARAIWWEEVDSDDVVEKVSQMIIDMNCMLFVIDALPLTNSARALAKRFPDVVRLNYYRGNEFKEEDRQHLDYEYKITTQDREAALDSYCDVFTPEYPRLVFPARVNEAGREVDFEDSVFAQHHLRGSQKDETEDKTLGKKVYKFKKNIPNHLFHSGNYAMTALALLAREEGNFTGIMPVFGSFLRA